MYYIEGIDTPDSHLLAGTTLAEDPTPAWAAGTHAVGYECHLVATHRVYKRTSAAASTAAPNVEAGWQDMRPTNKWAPFDIYTDTAATSTSADITYVLHTRFCNALMLRGLAGKELDLKIEKTAGGTVLLPTRTYRLQRASRGYWDYAFGTRQPVTALNLTDLPISANAVMTITVRADGTNKRAIGLINRGKLVALHGSGVRFGGTLADPEATPKTYTFRRTRDDGTQEWVPRASAKDLQCDVLMERAQAGPALQQIEGLLKRPVGWLMGLGPHMTEFSAFGFVTKGPVRPRGNHAICSLSIEGIV